MAARCGYKLASWSQDDDCVDVTIGAPGTVGVGTIAGPKIDVQLECTSDASRDQGEHVTCSLSRAHYERLRAESLAPMILVVVLLPAEEAHWLTHSAEELILRRCGYWVRLQHAPDFPEGQESWTVPVPKDNVFSPDTLMGLMERSSQGVPL